MINISAGFMQTDVEKSDLPDIEMDIIRQPPCVLNLVG